MDKSWVSIETKMCPACGKIFETNNLVMKSVPGSKKLISLEPTMDRKTVTGFKLCSEHDKSNDGYSTLIVVDKEKSGITGDRMTPEQAHLTGDILYLKKEAVIGLGFDTNDPFFYIDTDASDLLIDFYNKAISGKNTGLSPIEVSVNEDDKPEEQQIESA